MKLFAHVILKAFLMFLMLFLLVPLLHADTTIDLPGFGALDLTNFVANAGIMAAYDNHGTKWAGVSERVFWYPNDSTLPNPADNAWIGLEGCALWEPTTGKPSGLAVWLGLRADTLGAKIFGHAPSLGFLKIPAVEFGPMGSYLTAQKTVVYGGAFAKHF